MIEPEIRALATAKNFGALTVLLRDGAPMTHVMWVDADDEHMLINTEIHRAKYKAVQRDPRVALVVWDNDNPYRRAEVRGRVTGEIRGADARAHIDALSLRYDGHDYRNPIVSERVVLLVTPDRQKLSG